MEEKDISKEMMAGDEPIKDEDDDLLGWGEYARLIANAVGNTTSEASMVYAINGSWGSGKSSLLNLIERKIQKAQKDKVNENVRKTVIVHFEPWNCIDQNGIIKSFFDSLEKPILKYACKKVIGCVAYVVEIVFNFVARILGLSPERTFEAAVLNILAYLIGSYGKAVLKNKNNLQKRRDSLERYLKKQKKYRFLVIIDNLDRLNVLEIRLVMQLMKAICDFPNVSYLLAFDRKIVVKALDGEQPSGDGSGESYLSKIIQTTIDVPELPSDKAQEVCEKCLQQLFAEHGEKEVKVVYPVTYLIPLFKSLRSIKRYLREVNFALDEFTGEIDPLDLATLSAVKCIDRKALDIYIKFKFCLLGLENYDGARQKFNSEYAATFIGKYDDTLFDGIYLGLFPYAFGNLPASERVVSNRRVYNPEVLETYLKGLPTTTKISYRDAVNLLSMDNEDFLNACLKHELNGLDKVIKSKMRVLAQQEDDCLGAAKLITGLSNGGASQSSVCEWFKIILHGTPSLKNHLPAFINELEMITNFPLAYSLYWYLDMFFKKHESDIPDDAKDKLKEYKQHVVTNLMKNPYSIFEVSYNSFRSLVDETHEVSDFVEKSNDPKFLKKFIIKCELPKDSNVENSCEMSPMITKRLRLLNPYLDAWIEESQSLTAMAPFVVCKMLISGLKPDDECEGVCVSFSTWHISEYVEKHYPDKKPLLLNQTNCRRPPQMKVL